MTPPLRHHARRPAQIAAALTLGLVALTACGGTDARTSTSQTSGQGARGADLADRIASTVQASSPTIARAVRADGTTLTPVDVAALGDWQVVDVVHRGPSHPQRWYLGVRDGGREVVVLSGFPDRWQQVTAGAKVTSAGQAEQLAGVHADATRDMSVGYDRVDSVGDIDVAPRPSASDAARIGTLRRDRAREVTAASASGDGPWQVRLWTVTDGDLVRHRVDVAADGSVTGSTRVVESDLPVPHAR